MKGIFAALNSAVSKSSITQLDFAADFLFEGDENRLKIREIWKKNFVEDTITILFQLNWIKLIWKKLDVWGFQIRIIKFFFNHPSWIRRKFLIEYHFYEF